MSIRSTTAALMALIILASCGPSGAPKPDRKLLIPEDRLVDILTDTYLTAAMLDMPDLSATWGQRDSNLNYIDVIESHGYTYQQLDTTMRYYFNTKPKKLARIYDRVTGNLLELEVRVMEESNANPEDYADDNLWTGKASYSFPEDMTRDPVWFDIPVEKPGEYVLKADIRVFEDDQSIDPRVTVFFSTTDILGKEVRILWNEVRLEKNGQMQNIITANTLDSAGLVHIKGWLLNHSSQKGTWRKHARISNISLKLEREIVSQ
ncbi:MAG: DUF4296 domain-containing protein [Bacteroidales bacterium]|nr:DUF4296 domain-containing protein [Bacteroidales bacterium]